MNRQLRYARKAPLGGSLLLSFFLATPHQNFYRLPSKYTAAPSGSGYKIPGPDSELTDSDDTAGHTHNTYTNTQSTEPAS
jgi:hypothetical protein